MASNSLTVPSAAPQKLSPKPVAEDSPKKSQSKVARKYRDDEFTPLNNPANQQTLVFDAPEEPAAGQAKAPLDLTATVRKDTLDHVFTETWQHIFQRKSGGWYARLPDVEVSLSTKVLANNTTGKAGRSASMPNHPTNYSKETARETSSTELDLRLEWETQKLAANHQGLKFFSVSSSTQPPTEKKISSSESGTGQASSQNSSGVEVTASTLSEIETVPRVFWRHDVHHNLSILKLQRMVEAQNSDRLTESELGLTKRLLKTLRKLSERPYDVSKYSIDKTCIFFCFPYISLEPETRRKDPRIRNDPNHPPRALLQSHYRLNNTEHRDDCQCISWLEDEQVSSCISRRRSLSVPASRATTAGSLQRSTTTKPWSENMNSDSGSIIIGQNTTAGSPDYAIGKKKPGILRKKSPKHLFFVPQFWGLIVGLDTLVTMGTADEACLRGPSINVTQRESAGKPKLSLIRILFYHGLQSEEIIFPMSQCDSYFGLLNKKQQIIEFLKENEEPISKADLDLYTFSRQEDNDSVITMSDWGDLLREASNQEMLTIRMLKGPEFSVDAPAVSNPTTPVEKVRKDLPADYTATHKPPTPPFLRWKVQDEFGDEDKTADEVRVAKFLRAIYLKLPVQSQMTPKERRNRMQQLDDGRVKADVNINIREKTFKDLESHGTMPETEVLAKELRIKCKVLLSMYIPEEAGLEDGSKKIIQIFWGAIMVLVSRAAEDGKFREQLEGLIDDVDKMIGKAERIHRGVHCLVPELAGSTTPSVGNKITEGVILLASIVNSLGSIFRMFMEAARFADSPHKDRKHGLMNQPFNVSRHKDEALDYLEKAQSQLISEAHGIGSEAKDLIGPVLTPEAISIGLMERLVSGVSQSDTIDVVIIYEECLEYLSLKVKHEASRRLLQKINQFVEEVQIVTDVLNQQFKVLQQFKENLDPKTFNATSVARRLRYKYECKGIDRLQATVSEKINSLVELQRRGQELSTENIRLVETRQDDNSKAIFIFTIVTVLFLPSSAVAGFFGMNLHGIVDSGRDYRHFWKIAAPMTFGIIMLCGIVAVKGEDIQFKAQDMWRRSRNPKKRPYDEQTD